MIATRAGWCPGCGRKTVRKVEVDDPRQAMLLPRDIFWHESCLGKRLRERRNH